MVWSRNLGVGKRSRWRSITSKLVDPLDQVPGIVG